MFEIGTEVTLRDSVRRSVYGSRTGRVTFTSFGEGSSHVEVGVKWDGDTASTVYAAHELIQVAHLEERN